MRITLYIICYLHVSKVSSILHPVTFKFAYGHQSRGGRRRLPRHRLWRWFHLESFSQGNERLMALHLGTGRRPVSHVLSYLLPRSCCIAFSSFLLYAYNTEIAPKNSTMTLRWSSHEFLNTYTYIRINDNNRRLPNFIFHSKTGNECWKKIMRVLQTTKVDVWWSHQQARELSTSCAHHKGEEGRFNFLRDVFHEVRIESRVWSC